MIIDAGKRYAERGWHVLPVNGKLPSGGDGWPDKTTNDPAQVERVLAGATGLGVRLGPLSGIVDVECDSEQGYENLIKLMGGEIPEGVHYSSARGNHYLFKWSPAFPFTKAVTTIDGIEFRIGTMAACQSVFPPSPGREWIVSPDEKEIQEFPAIEKIVARLAELKAAKKIKHPAFELQQHYGGDGRLDVPKWLMKHGHEIIGRNEKDGMSIWYIECPNIHLHTSPNAYRDCCITQEANGRLGGHCFHQSCGMGSWDNLRSTIGELTREDFGDEEKSDIDLTEFMKSIHISDTEADDDEEFFASMVPSSGLIREIFDYYSLTAYKRSNAIGLAVAMSVCQTLFGRRIQSHTKLRTNDYNMVMAATASGKEACVSTTESLFEAGMAAARLQSHQGFLTAMGIQSGNALMREISELKCALWVCDEFGKHLQEILDKKNGNGHVKMIGKHLLQIYGRSNSRYSGDAHSDGRRNEVDQPHLCLLGMTTGEVFDTLKAEQINDGLIGRIVFWPVQKRPRRNKDMRLMPVPESLARRIAGWMTFSPGFEGIFPDPVTLRMTPEARQRWEDHVDAIDVRMDEESEVRTAIWGRVGTRAMKYALVHRAARFDKDPSTLSDTPIQIELRDVEWAIKFANWFARLSCGLVRESIVDTTVESLKTKIMKAIQELGEVTSTQILRTYRRAMAGDVNTALDELVKAGAIKVRKEGTKGRAKNVYFL